VLFDSFTNFVSNVFRTLQKQQDNVGAKDEHRNVKTREVSYSAFYNNVSLLADMGPIFYSNTGIQN